MKYISLIIVLLFTSCYSFRGSLPSNLKTIYIENFGNKEVRERNIAPEFTDLVYNGFLQDNTLIPVDKEDADLILSVTIEEILQKTADVKIEDGVAQTENYELWLRVSFECIITKTNQPLIEKEKGKSAQKLTIEASLSNSEREEKILLLMDMVKTDIIDQVIGAW